MASEIKYTHRTRDGRKARLIVTNRSDTYPVLALIQRSDGSEATQAYTADLRAVGYSGYDDNHWDLLEHNPWRDVPIDTPIWVSSGNAPAHDWFPGHFAGLNARGDYYYIWADQGTSHTKTVMESYLYATLENPFKTTTKE